jgi:hypothetical protein
MAFTVFLIIYGGLLCLAIYEMYDLYIKEQYPPIFLFGLLAAYLIYAIATSLNNSATPVIERSKIKSVKLIKAKPGLTRSHFKIEFEDEAGRIKQRLIVLQGDLQGGFVETKKAIKIMTEEGLLKSED